MNYVVQSTAPLARTTEQTQDKLLGYPQRGAHAGGGIHVDMPATWDGQGNPPPGWSSHVGSTRQHPTLSQWATPVNPECIPAMANGRRTRLTAPEQTKMQADITAAATLPGDWLPVLAQAKADEGGRA